jgi:hypothetical protein
MNGMLGRRVRIAIVVALVCLSLGGLAVAAKRISDSFGASPCTLASAESQFGLSLDTSVPAGPEVQQALARVQADSPGGVVLDQATGRMHSKVEPVVDGHDVAVVVLGNTYVIAAGPVRTGDVETVKADCAIAVYDSHNAQLLDFMQAGRTTP